MAEMKNSRFAHCYVPPAVFAPILLFVLNFVPSYAKRGQGTSRCRITAPKFSFPFPHRKDKNSTHPPGLPYAGFHTTPYRGCHSNFSYVHTFARPLSDQSFYKMGSIYCWTKSTRSKIVGLKYEITAITMLLAVLT